MRSPMAISLHTHRKTVDDNVHKSEQNTRKIRIIIIIIVTSTQRKREKGLIDFMVEREREGNRVRSQTTRQRAQKWS